MAVTPLAHHPIGGRVTSARERRCDAEPRLAARAAPGAREAREAQALVTEGARCVLVEAQIGVAPRAGERARVDLDLGGGIEEDGALGGAARLEASELLAVTGELLLGTLVDPAFGAGAGFLGHWGDRSLGGRPSPHGHVVPARPVEDEPSIRVQHPLAVEDHPVHRTRDAEHEMIVPELG